MQGQAEYIIQRLKELREERERRLEEALKAGRLGKQFSRRGRVVTKEIKPKVIRFPRKGER